MIKIGILGMSPGNAHPYSWSAIINGHFDSEEINRIGYPAVATYLEANQDTLGLPGSQVTHVWAQEKEIAESIARTTRIDYVVDRLEDMIGEVDAVILARDDPDHHVAMARPFLDAGIPLFVDKPLASTTADLAYFAEQHRQGRFIMSCSSMRYANECRTAKTELKALGKLELITAVGKKDWIKYGVHLLEAIFAILDDPAPVSVKHIGTSGKDSVHLEFEGGLQVVLHLFMDVTPTFQLSLFGREGWRLVEIKNSYSMFRDNIIEFIRSVEEGNSRLDFAKTSAIIRTVIGAKESLEKGGITVDLSQRL
ncbi:Gfo/Idh/MocA family oxidoreductase [Nibrella saemangeumensis]|uniref:Gfo/Idh/MocA family oxidoreductase n=1 Tax=Nibrella saemangeumensis TaxID=1084526 RepID=A0ABP8NFN4_9BACT